jgi:nicotinamidase/pyrazinamidase
MSVSHPTQEKSKTALIIVDVQQDFLPGGALGVPEGDEVVAPLLVAAEDADLVVATRDRHPADHSSFAAQGGIWPPHCVDGTPGYELDPQVAQAADFIIDKATERDVDAYSGFDGTDLAERLHKAGVTRVQVGGLATDYCVKATALDALTAGFDVEVLAFAARGVDVNRGDSDRALEAMQAAGAKIALVPDAAPKIAYSSPDSAADLERGL